MADLHPLEIRVLRALCSFPGPVPSEELARAAQTDKVSATRMAYFLSTKGYAALEEKARVFCKITDEGREVLAAGLPEKQVLRALRARGNLTIPHLVAASDGLPEEFVRISLGHLKKAALIEITKTAAGETACSITGKGAAFLEEGTAEEAALALIARAEAELPEEAARVLVHRNWARAAERKEHTIAATAEGRALVEAGIKAKETALTQEMLKTGAWRNLDFRAFDLSAPVAAPVPGKNHPLHSMIEKIRRAFLQMGFLEEKGPFVESTFWCFDALFQPQDHPARELADTFYMRVPKEASVPGDLVPKVKAAHEHGILGSRGWGGTWSERVTRQLVLRTHTTALSARSLSKYRPPAKIFTIDKAFRNETLDYKHLMELYQVEGIVFDENVTFRNLLGYLEEFYVKQMGFKKVRFRPAYFPYTEMSVEPEVFIEEKGEWMELGGAGIFRPEVVLPLTGVEYPVLAWGLGLDRLAMLKLGLSDIRANYENDLGWLREVVLP